MNRHRPCGPTDFRTPSAFAAAQEERSWSGLSLHRGVAALGAARLVSTPSRYRAWLGIASEGFPEFGQFYFGDFPPSTQLLKSGASTIPPRPRTPELYPNPTGLLSPVRLPFRHGARTHPAGASQYRCETRAVAAGVKRLVPGSIRCRMPGQGRRA